MQMVSIQLFDCCMCLGARLMHVIKLSKILLSVQQEPPENHREISYPSLVDSRGHHISYNIHKFSKKQLDSRIYFKLEAFGKKYLLNVSSSSHFVHSTPKNVPIVEYIGADGTSRTQKKMMNLSRPCFHSGHVHLIGQGDDAKSEDGASIDGWAAISSCSGLVSEI